MISFFIVVFLSTSILQDAVIIKPKPERPKPMTGTTRRDFLTIVARAAILPAFALRQDKIDLANINTRVEWRMARERILANMQLVMGELSKQKRPPVKIVKVHSEEAEAFNRLKIKYLSEGDDYVP